jgi:5,10-methylenetetrahydromethanopterin reductase
MVKIGVKIGTVLDTEGSVADVVAQAARIADAGFHSAWSTQIFGLDALATLAVVGASVPGLELGTAVVPVYGRHPQVLAQQAMTTQSASGGRLTLGIGLSHRIVVEGMWGESFDRPASYMAEYLDALVPLLEGRAAAHEGERLKAVTMGPLSIDAPRPGLLLAALAPRMLSLAGTLADGTVTWMTGITTVASHVAPLLSEAAAAAGRPSPRIAVALPICLTEDPERAAAMIDDELAIYPTLPSYAAMLEKEGAERASSIGLIGSAEQIIDGIGRLGEAGGTELLAGLGGTKAERQATFELLAELSRGGASG